LNLSRIPTNKQEAAKRDVGEFIVGEILRSVQRGQSPVEGRGSFKKLDPEYADEFKGGNRSPNLDQQGDMLDALEFEVTTGGVKVGIFEESQVPKADGHNNFSGLSELPVRRFIPDATEDFRRDIKSGVNQILDGYRENDFGRSVLDFADDFLVTTAASQFIQADDTISIESILAGLQGDLFE